ncbi:MULTISPECIES: hypothetical protein [unclassified Mesorhizobium]|uniref:hypothetical protein n=1 Tax=unclassified Mesorhizobium TaxID=325217 RepID=UPI00109392B5|nr:MULTISPECIES: hypothetical protein [unclassified Mesorhizobium]TGT90889.1 hypothetical protein EN804_06010 [Mesorhizobium sp. M8A.F.Ca.ET.161.01.1.1]TGV43831.1 hypothetical protein EN785_07535 [Mesorhizobium sp. M8A.F.Ca.ET.142.01.1.1]
MPNTDITFFHPGLSELELAAFDGLRAAQKLAHETATNAGWYVDRETGKPIERNFGEVIALMHSELSEALEADRKGKRRDDKLPHRGAVEVEFSDGIIRILDTAAANRIDVASAMIHCIRHLALYGDLPKRLPGVDQCAVNFANAIVRILEVSQANGYDQAGSVLDKNAYNRTRADHQLANRQAEGGKRY